jgi:HIP---CoA ligase
MQRASIANVIADGRTCPCSRPTAEQGTNIKLRTGMTGPSLYQAFQQSAARHSDRVAVRFNGRDIDYTALEQASRNMAKALLDLGISHGDRIAIWGINSAQWIIAALAIQAAGAVLVPLGTRLRGREVEGIVADAEVRIVFCDYGFGGYDFVAALGSIEAVSPPRVILMDEQGPSESAVMTFTDVLTGPCVADDAALDARIACGTGDDLCDIIFTSGTTGKPKGVPMTCARSLAACAAQQNDISRFTADDVFAISFPFAHNAGYRAGWQIALLHGVRILPIGIFDAGTMLELIEREGVTFLPVVVPVAQGLVDHPDRARYDLSSLRVVGTGGTTIPVKLIEDLRTHLAAGTEVQTGYGLTETAGSVSTTSPEDPAAIVSRTVGRAISNLEVRIVGPDHAELPRGEVGEIAVRGPQVMSGYYNNPAATAAAFTADGFLLTGDAASMDSTGCITITDRIKDMYLAGGFNCYPAEIEHVMRQMPGIAQVAVIGVPDARLGEVGKAFVVPAVGADLSEAAIIEWCRAEMANYKVPRSVVFMQALPVNATGKVAKTELRALV